MIFNIYKSYEPYTLAEKNVFVFFQNEGAELGQKSQSEFTSSKIPFYMVSA